MSAVLASDCSDHWSIPAMMTMMTLWVRAALTGSGAPCWVTRGLPMLARPAPAWLHHLLMMVSSLSQVSASASSESEPGLTGLDGPLPVFNSSTSVIHSGKQRLTVLNLNFWGLGWPWGSDKDVRYDLNSTLQLQFQCVSLSILHKFWFWFYISEYRRCGRSCYVATTILCCFRSWSVSTFSWTPSVLVRGFHNPRAGHGRT